MQEQKQKIYQKEIKIKMKPLRNLVLVKPCAPDEQTEGGLFIPESVRTRNSMAIVVEVGNKCKEAKKGNTIYHIKDAGDEVTIEGQQHFIIREPDILAYLSNSN